MRSEAQPGGKRASVPNRDFAGRGFRAYAWNNVPGQIIGSVTDLANWYATRPQTGRGYTGYLTFPQTAPQ